MVAADRHLTEAGPAAHELPGPEELPNTLSGFDRFAAPQRWGGDRARAACNWATSRQVRDEDVYAGLPDELHEIVRTWLVHQQKVMDSHRRRFAPLRKYLRAQQKKPTPAPVPQRNQDAVPAPPASTAVNVAQLSPVRVPALADGAVSGWRRRIAGVNHRLSGGYAVEGQDLAPGQAYRIPPGALVLVVDRFALCWEITLLRATDGGLERVHRWRRKSPVGKRILDFVARRLPGEHPECVALPGETNDQPARCEVCARSISAGRGWAAGARTAGGARRWRHARSCPAPRNPRAGTCLRCGEWVAAQAGRTARTEPGGPQGPVHRPGSCTAPRTAASRSRVNERGGWCRSCGRWVRSRHGRYDDGPLCRERDCAPEPELTWRLRMPRSRGNTPRENEVHLLRLVPKSFEQPVPATTPGYRLLDRSTGLVRFAAVLVEVHFGTTACDVRARAATESEAASVLAAEQAAVERLPVHESGFQASFSAERIGAHDPKSLWLAEITGFTRRGGLRRRFARPKVDYSGANAHGTRGIRHFWTLEINRIYEGCWPTDWRRTRRAFLRTTPDGDVVEVDRDEVENWFNTRTVT